MLSTWVFLAVVAGSFLYTDASAVFKCDQAVIDKVKKLGENPGLLPELATFGTMSIVMVTKDFFKSDIECTSIKFYEEDFKIKESVYSPLKQSRKNREEILEVVESDGSYSDNENLLKRYDVYSKNSVFATYTCSTAVQATTGPPAGFVAVGNGYAREQLNDAVSALTSVGVTVTETYPEICD